MVEVGLLAAFFGGLVSFFAPCVLPLIPAFLAHLAGTTVSGGRQLRIFFHTLMFVLGFSVIFVGLGLSAVGVLGYISQNVLNLVAGFLITIFGLHLLGVITIPFLDTERKVRVGGQPGYFASALIGGAFALGWTPCVGPVLAAILTLAGSSGSYFTGALYLFAFALGLGVPFLVVGLFTSQAQSWISKHSRYFATLNRIAGVLLVAIGLLILTGEYARVTATLYEFPALR